MWRALQAASSRIADCGKIVIAVSEDVDPNNANAVFWSMAYRSNPIDDVLVMPFRAPDHGPSSDSASDGAHDPRTANSTLLIDATLKHVMPPIALPAKPYMERARELWNKLNLPPISFQAPWHGYQLGDWRDSWEAFAQNATSGKWEDNGARYLRAPPRRRETRDSGALAGGVIAPRAIAGRPLETRCRRAR